MQIFKLVHGGKVDRIIGFNSLPESMLKGIRRGTIDGWPRHWKNWFKTDIKETGSNPFYILDYKTLNSDREKWDEITQYVRRSTDKNTRLLDKLEDMAVPLAEDQRTALSLEPEDVPVIPIVEEDEIKKARGKELVKT
jgi:hypothetical protein